MPVFTVKRSAPGVVQDSVTKDPENGLGEIWNVVWSMPLKRTYISDFEEYFPGKDGQPGGNTRLYRGGGVIGGIY